MTVPHFAAFIFSLLILLGCGLIVFQAKRSKDQFLNKMQLRRTVWELIVLNIIALLPLAGLIVASVFWPGKWSSAEWVTDLTLGTDMAAPIMLIAIYPLWFLLRPADSAQRFPVRTILVFFTFSLLTALFYYWLAPPLTDLIHYRKVLASEPSALPLALLVVGLGTIVLFALFGLREFLSISKRSAVDTAVLSNEAENDRSPVRWLMVTLGILALILWIVSLSTNCHGPESVCISPIFDGASQSPLFSSMASPLDRPPLVTFLIAVASIGMILFSLFFSFYVQPAEPSARLFTLLALLYGVSSIDIFPATGGVILFTIVTFGRILTMPVQIYFAWLFPQADLTTTQTKRRRVTLLIFIPFLVMSVFWIYFFLQSATMMTLANELVKSRESTLATLPDSFINDAIKLSFWFLSALSFLFANALTWLLSGWFIFRTRRRLSRRFESQKTDKTLSADLKEQVAAAWMQVKWFSFGLGLSAFVFLTLYFVLGTLIGAREGWGDVFLRFGLLSQFAFAALAIRRYRLWDIDDLINHGRVFITWAIGLLIPYGIIVWVLTRTVIKAWPAMTQEDAVVTIAPIVAMLLTLIFSQVRQPLQERLEKRFDRTQFDFNKKLDEVSEKLSRTVGTSALTTLLTETIPDDLQIEYAHIEPVPPQSDDINALIADQIAGGAALALPFTVGERITALYVIGPRRSGQQFSTKAQNLFLTMSYQAATAFENSRTWEALLDEYEYRDQISSNVHDNLSGELTVAGLFLDRLESDLKNLSGSMQHSYTGALNSLDSMRKDLNLVMSVFKSGLEPGSMSEPLTEKLETLAARLARAGKFNYHFLSDKACNYYPARIQQIIWVIVREALTNIVKHSDATLVSIRLESDSQCFIATIEDDGRGFENANGTGHGLPNMDKRAMRVGGNLLIKSAPGEGTTLKLTIPFPENRL